MKARQVQIDKEFAVEVREVELPPPADNQILVATEVSAVSPGTELAVYTGTHQWLRDPNLPDWKFPFRSPHWDHTISFVRHPWCLMRHRQP